MIHQVNQIGVFGRDDFPFELHGGGQFVVFGREQLGNDAEILNLLNPRQLGIDAFNFSLDQAHNFRSARQTAKVGVGHLVLLGIPSHMFLIDHDQAGEVLSGVANDHGISDVGTEFQKTFNVTGRDVLAPRGDQDVFDAISDGQVTIVINFAAITGVQPARFVQSLSRLVGQIPPNTF